MMAVAIVSRALYLSSCLSARPAASRQMLNETGCCNCRDAGAYDVGAGTGNLKGHIVFKYNVPTLITPN
jgi:hypothetical protein